MTTFGNLALVFATFLLFSCSRTQDLGQDVDAGLTADAYTAPGQDDASDDGHDGAGGHEGEPGPIAPVMLDARALCQELLDCASVQNPSQFPDFFPIYGTNGSCFSEHTEAACRQGCRDALKTLYDDYNASCDYCEEDRDCPLVNTSVARCHPSEHRCVSCLNDLDCERAFGTYIPYCTERFECDECRSDEQCDLASCAHDASSCNGGTCVHQAYKDQISFTLEASGLAIYEGRSVGYRITPSVARECAPELYDSVEPDDFEWVQNGGFALSRDDLVPEPFTLTVSVTDAVQNHTRWLELTIKPEAGSAVRVVLTASDFTEGE